MMILCPYGGPFVVCTSLLDETFLCIFLFSPKSKIIQPCSMCVKMKIAVQVTAGHDSVPFLGSLGNAFSAIPCFEQSYTSQVDTCLAL